MRKILKFDIIFIGGAVSKVEFSKHLLDERLFLSRFRQCYESSGSLLDSFMVDRWSLYQNVIPWSNSRRRASYIKL